MTPPTTLLACRHSLPSLVSDPGFYALVAMGGYSLGSRGLIVRHTYSVPELVRARIEEVMRKQAFPLWIAQFAFEPLEEALHSLVFGAELIGGRIAHMSESLPVCVWCRRIDRLLAPPEVRV